MRSVRQDEPGHGSPAVGWSSYPQLRLLALVACGARTVIDAVFGPTSSGETTYAADLVRSLHAGMRQFTEANSDWLTVVHRSAYAPDLNPVEGCCRPPTTAPARSSTSGSPA